jgi:sigma-B regulation protein RsbU (phosphoserine phosphatase)
MTPSLLSTLNLCLGGLVFLLGLVILRENPRQRLNRVVALMLFFGGFGSILATMSLVTTQHVAPAVAARNRALLSNLSPLWEFFFPTLFLFAAVFPEERAFTRRIPRFGTLVFAPHSFHLALGMALLLTKGHLVIPRTAVPQYLESVRDLGNLLIGLFLNVHLQLFSLVNLGYGFLSAFLLFESYRSAGVPRLKRQLRVIGLGLTTCLLLYSFSSSIPTLLGRGLEDSMRSVLAILALTAGSGSIAYAIVNYKFLDAKLLARRGILYAVACAALVGVYLAVVNRFNRLLVVLLGTQAHLFEPVFLMLALILFQPAIARLEELLEKAFLRDPGDYRNILRNLGPALLTTLDLDELLTRAIRTIADTLLLRTAYIVAFAHEGVVVQTGAGETIGPEDLAHIRRILLHLPQGRESFRLSDAIDGIDLSDRALLVGQLGAHLIIPLCTRGEVVGALLLGEKITGTSYTAEDVALLSSLAAQMSVSVQNALLVRDRVAVARFEEELELARRIQRSFLLSEFPVPPQFEVYATYLPAKRVGGDFYDLVPAGDGSFFLAIADVAGKGMPAALLSSMLTASLRTQARSIHSVPEILRTINALVYRSTAIEQFATFFLARVDGGSLHMTFSNAGHNYPVVLRRNGERVMLERGGIILGIQEGAEFEEGAVTLHTGDVVVFYTDGISEAVNDRGEQFGEERLCEVVHALPPDLSARDVTEHTLAALSTWLGEEDPRDDITLMVLRVHESAPTRVTFDAAREADAELATAV